MSGRYRLIFVMFILVLGIVYFSDDVLADHCGDNNLNCQNQDGACDISPYCQPMKCLSWSSGIPAHGCCAWQGSNHGESCNYGGGKVCSGSGASGRCVECINAEYCNHLDGSCREGRCSSNSCTYDPINVGGSCDGGRGNCNSNGDCIPKTCTPSCSGKSCGQSDGCGGKCSGSCPSGQFCNSNKQCENDPCPQNCGSEGYNCGTHTFCGVNRNCGSCNAGAGETCVSGVCIAGVTTKVGCEAQGFAWMGSGDSEPEGTCCGDAQSDCGEIFEEVNLCGMDENYENPVAYTVDGSVGDIVQVNCGEPRQYLGEPSTWLICDNSFKTVVSNHEYLCGDYSILPTTCGTESCTCCSSEDECLENNCNWKTGTCNPKQCENLWEELGSPGDGPVCSLSQSGGCPDLTFAYGITDDCKGGCCGTGPGNRCGEGEAPRTIPELVLYECAGNEGSNSHTAGEVRFTGQKVATAGNNFYCSRNNRWKIPDLPQEDCGDAGYIFTGNNCCGDSDEEYYNDENGGCFNGVAVFSESLVTNNTQPIEPSVMFFENQFYGCNARQELLDIDDSESIGKLIEGDEFCSNRGGFFCSTTSVWNLTNGEDRNDLSELPWQMPLPGVGDVNGDSVVNGVDLVLVKDVVEGNKASTDSVFDWGFDGFDIFNDGILNGFDNGDVNCDYLIDNEDVALILLYDVALIDSFDCENFRNSECCQPGDCWDGNKCIPSHIDAKEEPFFENYRCSEGEWIESSLKFDWNDEKSGYCPREDMCLVNPNGLSSKNSMPSEFIYGAGDNPNHPENMQCISDGQFILDHYCEEGSWTTRTKLIGIEMLEYIKDDNYVLHCDSYDESVNNFNYFFKHDIEDLLGEVNSNCFFNTPVGCTNDLCVMKYMESSIVGSVEKVLLGASLNKEINNLDGYSFLHVLGKEDTDYCSDVGSENQYYSCEDNDVWYNPVTASVIYARDGISLSDGGVIDLVSALFTGLKEYIIEIWTPEYENEVEINLESLDEAENFDRLYLNKNNEKFIRVWVQDTNLNRFLTGRYTGFSDNICNSVSTFNVREGFDLRRNKNEIDCIFKDNSYNVFSSQGVPYNWVGDLAWDDLTTKVRMERVDSFCGDGTCNLGENFDTCPEDCDFICGDSIVEGPEECDKGLENGDVCIPTYGDSCEYCNENCKIVKVQAPFCGDNNCDEGEDLVSCESDCAVCGDLIVSSSEDCDDGNNLDGDGCSSNCFTETPEGHHDGNDCNFITGWTCDGNDYSSPLEVKIYVDGDSSSGTFAGSFIASNTREQAVADLCGGFADRGFRILTTDLTVDVFDSVEHEIYVYATNIPSGPEFLLSGSPKTLTCS